MTKEECLDLPETTDVIQRIDLEPEAMQLYRQLVTESFAALLRDTVTATNVLTRLMLVDGLLYGDNPFQ